MGIVKKRDLKKLEKIGKELESLIEGIRKYIPDATLYLQDDSFSIHYDHFESVDKEPNAKSEGYAYVKHLDCGGGFNGTEFID